MSESDFLERWDETISLLDAYEGLLSPTQKEILGMYFRFNLSLSEIAEERGSSRAAISDALRKGVEKLRHYERELGFVKTKQTTLQYADEVLASSDLKAAKEAAKKIKEAFTDGI